MKLLRGRIKDLLVNGSGYDYGSGYGRGSGAGIGIGNGRGSGLGLIKVDDNRNIITNTNVIEVIER